MINKRSKKYILIVYAGFMMVSVTMGLSFLVSALWAFQMRKISGWQQTHIIWQLKTAKWFFLFSALLLGWGVSLFSMDAASFSLVGEAEKGALIRLTILLLSVGLVFIWYYYHVIKGILRALKDEAI